MFLCRVDRAFTVISTYSRWSHDSAAAARYVLQSNWHQMARSWWVWRRFSGPKQTNSYPVVEAGVLKSCGVLRRHGFEQRNGRHWDSLEIFKDSFSVIFMLQLHQQIMCLTRKKVAPFCNMGIWRIAIHQMLTCVMWFMSNYRGYTDIPRLSISCRIMLTKNMYDLQVEIAVQM